MRLRLPDQNSSLLRLNSYMGSLGTVVLGKEGKC
jgi:hypothetical protein